MWDMNVITVYFYLFNFCNEQKNHLYFLYTCICDVRASYRTHTLYVHIYGFLCCVHFQSSFWHEILKSALRADAQFVIPYFVPQDASKLDLFVHLPKLKWRKFRSKTLNLFFMYFHELSARENFGFHRKCPYSSVHTRKPSS